MIRELALSLALVALIVCVPGIVQAGAPPPNFYFTVISDQVTTGEPLLLQVVGPPNATFTVTLNPEPFNTSQPVFSQFYQLPPVAALANGSAIGEVSVNTSLFAISAYRMSVASANSTIFGREVVYVTVGTPTAVLAGQLEQLRFDLAENASRVISLGEALDMENVVYLYVVGLSITLFGILMFTIIATRTAAGERRFMRSLKGGISRLSFRGPAGMTAGHWAIEEQMSGINTERIWVAGLCPRCELRHTRSELFAHMRAVHRMDGEQAEKYVRISREARREVRRKLEEEILPSMRQAPKAKPAPVLDLSDLPEN